jgi:hypothetical protein
MDHVRKLDVFSAVRVERSDATSVVQVQVRYEQPQRRTNRLRMPDKLERDSGCGGAGSNAHQQAEVRARTGGSAFLEKTAHEAEWHAI